MGSAEEVAVSAAVAGVRAAEVSLADVRLRAAERVAEAQQRLADRRARLAEVSPPSWDRCEFCGGMYLEDPLCVCVVPVDVVRVALRRSLESLGADALAVSSTSVAVFAQTLMEMGVVIPSVLGAVCSGCGRPDLRIDSSGMVAEHAHAVSADGVEFSCPGSGQPPRVGP